MIPLKGKRTRDYWINRLILLLVVGLMTIVWRQPEPAAADGKRAAERLTGSAKNLPSRLERSDWNSILEAHEAWKQEVRAAGEGWSAHNAETGLTATFDRRGIRSSRMGLIGAGGWSWHRMARVPSRL